MEVIPIFAERRSHRPPAPLVEVSRMLEAAVGPLLALRGPITKERLGKMQDAINLTIPSLPRVWVERNGITVGTVQVLAARLIPAENRRGVQIRVMTTTEPIMTFPGR